MDSILSVGSPFALFVLFVFFAVSPGAVRRAAARAMARIEKSNFFIFIKDTSFHIFISRPEGGADLT